jgi:threonine dehydrogenase-like Zn-dependent dehydrogenase
LPGPDWVRVRTTLGGVCGTDLAVIAQRNHPASILQRFASFPAVLGHENVGVIETCGAAVAGWRPDQRVCVEPAIGCAGRGIEPACGQCIAGRPTLCEHAGDDRLPARALVGLNARTGGTWATHFVAHLSQLHAVPDGVSDEAAVLTDPIASAAHAVLRRPPEPGERVLVNGSGIIALGIVATLRALGHDNPVLCVVRHAFQAALASRLGASDVLQQSRRAGQGPRYEQVAQHVGGTRVPARFGNQALMGGFDLTYDCTGSGAGLTDALKWTRSRGTVVAAGTSGIAVVDTTPLWFDEITVIGANGRQVETVNGGQRHTYDLVLDWMARGVLDMSAIPVTRYPLSAYRTALAHLLSRGKHPIVKAAFDPWR